MANKQRNDGHISLNAQQVAFMHQVIESEDKHRAKFSKSPPRRKRNPILGLANFPVLKKYYINHSDKVAYVVENGRRRCKCCNGLVRNKPKIMGLRKWVPKLT